MIAGDEPSFDSAGRSAIYPNPVVATTELESRLLTRMLGSGITASPTRVCALTTARGDPMTEETVHHQPGLLDHSAQLF